MNKSNKRKMHFWSFIGGLSFLSLVACLAFGAGSLADGHLLIGFLFLLGTLLSIFGLSLYQTNYRTYRKIKQRSKAKNISSKEETCHQAS